MNCTTAIVAKNPMNASNSIVRCGVDERYCCRTYWAISNGEELDLSVVGPEERGFVVVVVVVDGAVVAGAEGDAAAACRFGAIAETEVVC